jgi:teichuronic acid biosynthesis glycosyltransferase TuaG
MTEVSVIMPNYNCAKYIGQAIESVISQSYQDWELLICDDGSKDSSIEIIERYLSDPRVKLIKNSTNCGATQSRNNAIAASNGTYIAFLDSDDFWYPEKLALQLEHMKTHNANICYTDYHLLPEGEETLHLISARKKLKYKDLLKGRRFGILTVLLKKSILPTPAFTQWRNSEDLSLWLRLLRGGEVAYGVQTPLACYRLVKNSKSAKKLRLARSVWNILYRQENLPLPIAAYYFANYVAIMLVKYARILPKVLRVN